VCACVYGCVFMGVCLCVCVCVCVCVGRALEHNKQARVEQVKFFVSKVHASPSYLWRVSQNSLESFNLFETIASALLLQIVRHVANSRQKVLLPLEHEPQVALIRCPRLERVNELRVDTREQPCRCAPLVLALDQEVPVQEAS
jgi:hypothetical protein